MNGLERPDDAANAVSAADSDRFVADVFAAFALPLTRRLAARTGDAALAEDLVQEASARLVAEVRRGRRPDNPAGWLHRVATNLLVSDVRRRRVQAAWLASGRSAATAPSAETVAVARADLRAAAGAIAGLPVASRVAVELAAGGASHRVISERLGRSDMASRAVVSRARASIRLAVS